MISNNVLSTVAVVDPPAFVLDTSAASNQVSSLRNVLTPFQSSLLYSPKACAIIGLVKQLAADIDGFSVSSLNELTLINSVTERSYVHMVSPVLKAAEAMAVATAVDTITMNSMTQWSQLGTVVPPSCRLGLRINPKEQVTDNVRYDPCRKHSKLGVELETLLRGWRDGDLKGMSGIHFHTACCSTSWEPLLRTIKVIERKLAPMMHELEWINLGGGYEWNEETDFEPLQETIDLLTNTYGLKVFLEPGSGIVNSAGSLISSVVDLFESDGKTVAILDTSVNHLPEVFEYQYEPDVAEHVDGAPHEYILAGCSCLAGDLFGEYTFEEPLDIGSRITFENVGAYSLVKANMFNGINLPSIHILQEDGRLDLIREFTYEDYLARCGGEAHAVMPAGV